MTNEQFEAIKTIKLEKLGLLLIKYFAYLGLFTTYEGLKYSVRKGLCLQSPAETA